MPSFISWIPTPPEDVEGFFELVTVSPSDVVYDLGAGDGRLLFAALDKGAGRAIGVEMDPERVRLAREDIGKKGLEDRFTFVESDVMDVDLSGASVVLCYLSTTASEALKPKLEAELKPGTRVVMETFSVPGWKPVRTFTRDYKQFYLYVMPPEKGNEYPTATSTDYS